jgi:hypothetical protein
MAESDDTAERWLPVAGWEDVYEVSDLGRLRRIKPSGSIKHVPVLLTGGLVAGYRVAQLNDNGRRWAQAIHRLVAMAFLAPDPGRPWVNHKDGNRTNNAVSNLEWSTPSENILHGYHVLGRRKLLGLANGRCKLTENQVREIRSRWAAGGLTQRQLGALYGVSNLMVHCIVTRKNWTHVV